MAVRSIIHLRTQTITIMLAAVAHIRRFYWLSVIVCIYPVVALGQTDFPDKCIGDWTGKMYIYQKGTVKDSVDILFSVAPKSTKSWSWRTSYVSAAYPLVKDYIIQRADTTSNRYVVDEGGGVVLYEYQFDNKLYAAFETRNVFLTSTYELRSNGELVFEVTSGKKIAGKDTDEVTNYSIDVLQKVVLRRK